MRDDKIITHEDMHNGRPLRALLTRMAARDKRHLPSGPNQGSITPRVNWGRWLVDCPNPTCASAQVVSVGWPIYVCPRCEAGPYDVVWPREWQAIETTLLRRPNPQNRNWEPGERIRDLVRENKEHGVRE